MAHRDPLLARGKRHGASLGDFANRSALGLGGVFLKLDDPKGASSWLDEKLGLEMKPWGKKFPWRSVDTNEEGSTVLSLFSADSDKFAPSERGFMINLRVDDLDAALVDLEARGVQILNRLPDDGFGKFAQVLGPDGMKIELWQPAKT